MASGSSAVRDPLRVAVVGGGVAGLSTAYFVEKYATEAGLRVDTHLLEAQERVGGHIVSEHKDGFLIEGGPDCFLSRKPGGMELVRELGLEGDLVGTESRNARTFVLSGGMLHPLPEGTMLMIPTKVLPVASSRLLSWKGKLRMGLDLVLPRGGQGGDESLGAFVRRRLGEEALRKIAEPLVAGVHAGDPDVLSLASTFSRFKEMEDKDRSLILAMLRARRRAGQAREVGDKGAPSAFVALRGGMDGLTRGLRDGLSDGVVNTGRKVTVVTPAADTSGGYVLDVESSDGIDRLEVDQVILALPAWKPAKMIRDLTGHWLTSLERYPSTLRRRSPWAIRWIGWGLSSTDMVSLCHGERSALSWGSPGAPPSLRGGLLRGVWRYGPSLVEYGILRSIRAQMRRLLTGLPVM